MEPGAMLYEASKEFYKGSQKSDEYIRMIKEKLDVAVSQCIQAAGHEIQPSKQKQLLRAATFGNVFSQITVQNHLLTCVRCYEF